jgi:hypothetical protein
VTALQAVRAVKAQPEGLCPDIPDECWFDSRLPSMHAGGVLEAEAQASAAGQPRAEVCQGC